jgi:hypothetical protein
MKNILCVFFFCIVVSGCNTDFNGGSWTQKYDVQSPQCKIVDGILQYQNDTIQIGYVFWAEGGVLGLYIHNNLDKPLYIDWRKCSFITGLQKHDYWNDNVTVEQKGNVKGGTTAFGFGALISKTSFSSSSVTQISKEERITFIPPGTTIERIFFKIINKPIVIKDGIEKDILLTIQKNKVNIHLLSKDYSKETSPFTFRSFLTYSTNDNFASEVYVNNLFYVSHVLQLSGMAFDWVEGGRDFWRTGNSFYLDEYGE